MKRRLRIIMFAAMVAVVGCKTQTAFYAERVYHAEGHWPKESTDEGGKWTLDFYASRDVSDVSEYKRGGGDTIWASSFGCGKKYESDVADKVLAAHFPFKISNLRLTMSRRFSIIELF